MLSNVKDSILHKSFKHGWWYHYRIHDPKTKQLCSNGLSTMGKYLHNVMDDSLDNEPTATTDETNPTTVPLPKSKKQTNTSTPAQAKPNPKPDNAASLAESGEIIWTKNKLKNLKMLTPSDVLVEADCGDLNPDTLEGMTKDQFAAIKIVLKESK